MTDPSGRGGERSNAPTFPPKSSLVATSSHSADSNVAGDVAISPVTVDSFSPIHQSPVSVDPKFSVGSRSSSAGEPASPTSPLIDKVKAQTTHILSKPTPARHGVAGVFGYDPQRLPTFGGVPIGSGSFGGVMAGFHNGLSTSQGSRVSSDAGDGADDVEGGSPKSIADEGGSAKSDDDPDIN